MTSFQSQVSTTRVKAGEKPDWIREIEAAKTMETDEEPTALKLMVARNADDDDDDLRWL